MYIYGLIAFCGAKPCKKSYSSRPYIHVHPARRTFCGAKPRKCPFRVWGPWQTKRVGQGAWTNYVGVFKAHPPLARGLVQLVQPPCPTCPSSGFFWFGASSWGTSERGAAHILAKCSNDKKRTWTSWTRRLDKLDKSSCKWRMCFKNANIICPSSLSKFRFPL